MLLSTFRSWGSALLLTVCASSALGGSDSPSPFSGGTEERSEKNVNASAEAERAVDSLLPILMGGISLGGDHISDLDGIQTENDTVKAGGAWFLGGGFHYTLPGLNLAFQSTFSLHYNGDDHTEGKSRIVRFPLDFLLQYTMGKQYLGAGITYHLSPEARNTDHSFKTTVKLKDAIGLLLEYDYRITERFAVGTRLTKISYKQEEGDSDIDGSNIAFVGYYFY